MASYCALHHIILIIHTIKVWAWTAKIKVWWYRSRFKTEHTFTENWNSERFLSVMRAKRWTHVLARNWTYFGKERIVLGKGLHGLTFALKRRSAVNIITAQTCVDNNPSLIKNVWDHCFHYEFCNLASHIFLNSISKRSIGDYSHAASNYN